MAAGKDKYSPIVQAIAEAEKNTTGEIRVHLTKGVIEPDAFKRATRLFKKFKLDQTANRNAVLLYVNLRKHKFAVIGDEGIHRVVGQRYWEAIARDLRQNLLSTYPENAIAQAVRAIGATLEKHFPAHASTHNPNELPNEVSEDE